eukprot:scaffold4707_cov164-Amphora_coffeaeformis.AAC.3
MKGFNLHDLHDASKRVRLSSSSRINHEQISSRQRSSVENPGSCAVTEREQEDVSHYYEYHHKHIPEKSTTCRSVVLFSGRLIDVKHASQSNAGLRKRRYGASSVVRKERLPYDTSFLGQWETSRGQIGRPSTSQPNHVELST